MTDKLSDTVTISPVGSMDLLSQMEVAKLRDVGSGDLRERFRRCALAVLNTGSTLDDARAVYERFADFEIELLQVERGIRLRMQNAPAQAFVEGELIHGIREHRPGESLRRVDWKTSARTGELMVREMEDGSRLDLAVVVGDDGEMEHDGIKAGNGIQVFHGSDIIPYSLGGAGGSHFLAVPGFDRQGRDSLCGVSVQKSATYRGLLGRKAARRYHWGLFRHGCPSHRRSNRSAAHGGAAVQAVSGSLRCSCSACSETSPGT
jgi:hypothetical protein